MNDIEVNAIFHQACKLLVPECKNRNWDMLHVCHDWHNQCDPQSCPMVRMKGQDCAMYKRVFGAIQSLEEDIELLQSK